MPNAPVSMEDREFDILAFELWHLGNYPDVELEELPEDEGVAASRSRYL